MIQTVLTTSSPEQAIVIDNVSKTYAAQGKAPAKIALENISFTVPRGSMFALLGPNGAGKSTLINILAGVVNKTAGNITIWDHNIDQFRKKTKFFLGVVPQEINIDPFFTPLEALNVQAGYYGVPSGQRKILEILEALGLGDKANSFARTLSGGMRRRLMVAKAMVHQPPILILDEPTAGVDIHLRQQLWAYVKELNKSGITVVLTTHYLEEAQELCDYVAIINKGKLVACDHKKKLLQGMDQKTLLVGIQEELTDIPPALQPFQPTLLTPSQLQFQLRLGDQAVSNVLEALNSANLHLTDISTKEANLEDVFLRFTKD